MAQVNPLTREVLIKLVYYGPGLGGKTTTLQRVHSVSPAETRGKIVSLATPVDRTLYFDFLPLRIAPVNGYPVRLQLFTVPGQVYFNATRKLVLTGADGVVFVADSQRERQDANLESLQNLNANLAEQGRQLRDMPHVLQLNKRDLPNVGTVEQLTQALNALDAPVFESSAARGEGVLEPLDELVRLVLADLDRRSVFGDPAQRKQRKGGQPSFGPAADGLGESLSRASEELWQASGPPPAGVRKSEPPEEVAIPKPPPPVRMGVPPLADEPPVQLSQPYASEPPMPTQVPGAEPLGEDADGHEPDHGMNGAEHAQHSSIPSQEDTPSPRPPSFHAGAHSKPGHTHKTPQGHGGPSFRGLFSEDLQESVVELEAELRAGEASAAVLRCESLAAELLAHVAGDSAVPTVERQPLTLALALGLDGRRWLNLCRLAHRAKHGEPVTVNEALTAYALVIELRRLSAARL